MTHPLRRLAPAAAAILCATLALGTPWTSDVSAQQTSSAIFQLVTFDAGAGPPLGATEGDGGADRVFHPAAAARLKPPVPNPSKVFGLAGNYPREGDLAHPKYPSVFFKSVASLVGQEDVIDLAGLVTTGVHEPEMAFVIGKRAKNVSEAQAFDYVFGYTIHNIERLGTLRNRVVAKASGPSER